MTETHADPTDSTGSTDPTESTGPTGAPGPVESAGPARWAAPRPLHPTSIRRLGAVASTQDEASALFARGVAAPFVVTAREQLSGRGRLGRAYASPDGGSVYLTYVHRTGLELARRSWFPLAAGLAALAAVASAVGEDGVRLGLKWPNDLHTADGRKLGGILVEGRGADGVLIGIGLNVRGPVVDGEGAAIPGAAWLLGPDGIRNGDGMTGCEDPDALRERIEEALAGSLRAELEALESSQGDAVTAGTMHRYTMTCLTLGQEVRIDPLGTAGAEGARPPSLYGRARAVDDRGRLLVDLPEGERVPVDVGDVRHVRPGGTVRTTTDAVQGVEQEDSSR